MLQLTKILKEIGDSSANKYSWKIVKSKGDINVPATGWSTDDMVYRVYEFRSKSRLKYTVTIENEWSRWPKLSGYLKVDFTTGGGRYVVTNRGEMYSVMATVVDIVKDALKDAPDAKGISYSPESKGDDGGEHRDRLYRAYLSKAFPGIRFSKSMIGIIGTF